MTITISAAGGINLQDLQDFASAKREPTTTDNLKDAADGENQEWTDMYARMAREAREEGFTEIAAKFEMVGAIEREHEKRYRRLLKNIEEGLVFSREGDMIWQCSNCGHIVVGKKAPPRSAPSATTSRPTSSSSPRTIDYIS